MYTKEVLKLLSAQDQMNDLVNTTSVTPEGPSPLFCYHNYVFCMHMATPGFKHILSW